MIKDIKNQEMKTMDRVTRVLDHPIFVSNLNKLAELERDRIWCRHGMDHLVDVARIAYIFALERGADIAKDVIYATGLLHDIGRSRQYIDGTPHAEGGIELAAEVLSDCGFSDEESEMMLQAIAEHSDEYDCERGSTELSVILYDADKASRACFSCPVEEQCKWEEELKNHTILW